MLLPLAMELSPRNSLLVMAFILSPYLFQPEKYLQHFPEMKLLGMFLKPLPLGLCHMLLRIPPFPLLVDSGSFSVRFPHTIVRPLKAPYSDYVTFKPILCCSEWFPFEPVDILINPRPFSWSWLERLIQGNWSLIYCCSPKPATNSVRREPQKYSTAHVTLSCLVV